MRKKTSSSKSCLQLCKRGGAESQLGPDGDMANELGEKQDQGQMEIMQRCGRLQKVLSCGIR